MKHWLGIVTSVVTVFVLGGCGSDGSSGSSCGDMAGTYVSEGGTCPAPFSCTLDASCTASCSDGNTLRVSPAGSGFTFTSAEGASCSASLDGTSLTGSCVHDGTSCTFASTFTKAEPDGVGGTSSQPEACSMQVQSGTQTECDWSYGISDPEIACSDVPVYSTVTGVICDGACTDVNSSDAHCGECMHSCVGGTTCQQGLCRAQAAGGAAGGGGSGAGGSGAGGSGTGGSGAGGSSAGGSGVGGSGAGGSGAGGGAGGDPCAAFPDDGYGYACGVNLGLGASAALYYCNDYTTVGVVTCKQGCHASGLGTPDYCNDSDPCSNSSWNEPICGANLSPLANPNRLYYCNNQVTSQTLDCQNGCYAAPYGQSDSCSE